MKNGAWDATKADVIAGQWDRSIVGMRSDITFTMHDDAVISDADGKVVFNAMQQDSRVMRVVTRLAHVIVDQEVNQHGGQPGRDPRSRAETGRTWDRRYHPRSARAVSWPAWRAWRSGSRT